jgi:heptosyltransferase-2
MTFSNATLVVGPSWVGDAVMAQCLLAALKRQDPQAAIDVLAPDWVVPIFTRIPEVREAIAVPFGHGDLALRRRLALGAGLRGLYGRSYVLPGSWKSALVPWAARIPIRCGYLREWRFGLLNDVRNLPEAERRVTAVAFQALADPSVIRDRSRLIVPRLDVHQENRTALLLRHGLDVDSFCAMAPGAEFGAAKRWPTRHWIELCRKLSQFGVQTVLLGSKNDSAVTGSIASECPGVLDLAGRTGLADAVDILSAARMAVTNDSGLMHVAAGVGVPIVALYGSSAPGDTPPLSGNARVETLGLACSPCRKRTCPLGHFDCMEKLTVDRVVARMRELGLDLQRVSSSI